MTDVALERVGGMVTFVDFFFRGVTSAETLDGSSDSCTGDSTELTPSIPWNDGRGGGEEFGGAGCGGTGEGLGGMGGSSECSGGGNWTEFRAKKVLVDQIFCSYRRLRLLVAGVIVKMLAKDRRVLPVDFWRTGASNLRL